MSARSSGIGTAAALVAIVVAGPLLSLPASFLVERDALSRFAVFLPDALTATVLLIVGVGLGTLVIGTFLAALVAFFEFPGRRLVEWALVLPLAMPGYVFTLFALGTVGRAVPELRSVGGAIVIFTLVLYPYVYLLARAAFLGQPRSLMEAARGLGASRLRAFVRVAMPLARPAILGGVVLALMEALADFGTVNLLGVETFTNAIYKVWFNAFDRPAAMQLATLLASITVTLLFVEQLLRGRIARVEGGGRSAGARTRLRGALGWLALSVPLLLVGVVVVAPLAQLARWALQTIRSGAVDPGFVAAARNSVLLATTAALFVCAIAALLAYSLREAATGRRHALVRLATIGYGLPGSVVAAAVIAPLAFLDERIAALPFWPERAPLPFTGTVLGLLFAYCVRFLAIGFQPVRAALERIPRSFDEAARSLGADEGGVVRRVHVPLLRPSLLTAGVLVFAETMKELPATVLLRPLGGDTLAVKVWQATAESLWQVAALPALLIVACSLMPVVLAIRLSLPAAGRRRRRAFIAERDLLGIEAPA